MYAFSLKNYIITIHKERILILFTLIWLCYNITLTALSKRILYFKNQNKTKYLEDHYHKHNDWKLLKISMFIKETFW